ncbi:hypothetical protein JCM6882_002985 [Rhodosporidiobolus microsporus]
MMDIVIRPFVGGASALSLDVTPSSTCGEAHAQIREKLHYRPGHHTELHVDDKRVDEAKTLEESGITADSYWQLFPHGSTEWRQGR